MKENRRDFLKQIAIGGIGLTVAPGLKANEMVSNEIKTISGYKTKSNQYNNMCGYRAPILKTVRTGFVGVGNRGYSNLNQMTFLDGVEIKAICDIAQFRIDEAQQLLQKRGLPTAGVYTGSNDAWRGLCENPDIDLISIAVPRGPLHARISVYAMECGKHVAVEVPAVATVDEAWNIVETSENTMKHCYMMENCCYDFFELLTLNMARQGFFGDIIHGDAAYLHFQKIYEKTRDNDMWRLEESQYHDGNIYPTHGLGPVCQIMNINRGDKLSHMVSMSSDDFMLGKNVAELASSDPFYQKFNTDSYRGNINTSIIRTEKGRTIMLQHDTTSPRVYSRIHAISGTRAAAQKYPLPARISVGDEWLNEEEMKKVNEQYMPKIVKRIGDMAQEVGGHGGMDFLMTWRLIDCLRNGLPMDIDVYDAAAWSVITSLSQWSLSNNSRPIEVPDFTRGAWQGNQPVDISLSEGGNTSVKKSIN
ncbi:MULTISPECIES: Gfo/Idh/MocA family oxidoreductase [unclassified Proteiniphilum]|jgi:hypothetical protein|uniref:Gfo/Idh/MocA family protein n=1 Tax=unclassified Proteiniphilum TaxID=2622718 RepID=UPI00257FB1CC|nr:MULTISPECIES: Gfo/Idh/MocA family oxidoreductase [unclassified Proteiniphilum]